MKKTCSTTGRYQSPSIEALQLVCGTALAASNDDGVTLDEMIEVEETW